MNDTDEGIVDNVNDSPAAAEGLGAEAPAPGPRAKAGRPTGKRDGQTRGPDRLTMGLVVVAALVAVGGIGFAVGHVTAPSAAAAGNGTGTRAFARASLAPGQTFNATRGGAGGFGGVAAGVSGTVQSIDGSTITILEANGTTATIDLSGSTTYHSEISANASQVAVGSGVTVQIDTAALASQSPAPGASGALGGRTLTASSILITQP